MNSTKTKINQKKNRSMASLREIFLPVFMKLKRIKEAKTINAPVT